MNTCKKKEFFAAHASQQDQLDLNGSVLLAIFSQCGGFFLRGGDTTVVSLLLMAGTCACCLGIRYAQSRSWAVLLLLLGCGNFLLGLRPQARPWAECCWGRAFGAWRAPSASTGATSVFWLRVRKKRNRDKM